jgi:putative flippase GtrA
MNAKDLSEIIKAYVRPVSMVAFIAVFLWATVAIIRWLLVKMATVEIEPALVVPIIIGIVTTFSTSVIWLVGSWWGGRQAKPPTNNTP